MIDKEAATALAGEILRRAKHLRRDLGLVSLALRSRPLSPKLPNRPTLMLGTPMPMTPEAWVHKLAAALDLPWSGSALLRAPGDSADEGLQAETFREIPTLQGTCPHAVTEPERLLMTRPARPGVSVGNDSGTIGVGVHVDAQPGYFITAAHVVAKPSSLPAVGDVIYQPSLGDPDAAPIGVLERWVRADQVDVALVSTSDGGSGRVLGSTPLGGRPIAGHRTAVQDEGVWKSGRTTGITKSTILAVGSAVYLPQGNGNWWDSLVQYGAVTCGGDSGACIVSESDDRALAIHVRATSSRAYGIPMQRVINELEAARDLPWRDPKAPEPRVIRSLGTIQIRVDGW